MSIRLVVTRGFGNGTFNGTINDIAVRGFTVGDAVETPEVVAPPRAKGGGGKESSGRREDYDQIREMVEIADQDFHDIARILAMSGILDEH